MGNTIEVQTEIGIFELIKPKAGVRNRAIAKAETDQGILKQSVLMMELMPKCVNRRPEGIDQDVPIEQVLDSLEIEDYDNLFIALSTMIKPQDDDDGEKKKMKSELSSTTESSQSPSVPPSG